MAGMTIKQSQRARYLNLCRAYNRACRRVEEALPETTVNFVHFSLVLHAAKGWDGIPKYWCSNAFICKQGV